MLHLLAFGGYELHGPSWGWCLTVFTGLHGKEEASNHDIRSVGVNGVVRSPCWMGELAWCSALRNLGVIALWRFGGGSVFSHAGICEFHHEFHVHDKNATEEGQVE